MNQAIYLFYGENEFELKKAIKDMVCQSKANLVELEAGYSVSDLIQLLNTPSFFSDKNLYLVEDEGILNSEEDLSILDQYLNNPASFSILVLAFSKKIDQRKKLIKYFKSKQLTKEFTLKKGQSIEKWIKGFFWDKGYDIDQQSIFFLLTSVGENQMLLETELEKIILFAPSEKKLTLKDIKPIVSHHIQGNIFKLLDGMMDKNGDQLINSLENLFKLKEPEVRILFMLIREYRLTLLCKASLKEGLRQDDILKELNIHPFVGRKVIARAGKFTFKELLNSLKTLYELEEKLKTGQGQGKVLLESTLLGLM